MQKSASDADLLSGMVYAAAIFVAMWFVFLPLIDPAMLLVNGPGFVFSHLMYGALLGVGIAFVRARTPRLATA